MQRLPCLSTSVDSGQSMVLCGLEWVPGLASFGGRRPSEICRRISCLFGENSRFEYENSRFHGKCIDLFHFKKCLKIFINFVFVLFQLKILENLLRISI